MKKLLIFLLISSAIHCQAQQRVTDRSGRKPAWVNGLEKDFIIAVGSSATLQEAQKNALNMVRESIVNAVAQNVQATSQMFIEESSISNNVSFYLEKFATTVTTTSGPVPFLQGISLSKVEDYYWEKVQDRNSRTEIYNYHIKYPFSDFELQRLVTDFRIRDRELTEKLENLLAAVETITAIEQIETNIAELRILTDFFVDGRKEMARMGITRYRNLYNSIELVEMGSDLGELRFALRFGERLITASQRPQITSECARITSTSTSDNVVVVKYDYQNCYENPENNITVRYRFGNTNVQKAFYFDVTANKASVFVSEPIRFNVVSTAGSFVDQSTVDIVVVSRYDAPFTITRVVLEWPGHAPVVVDNINRSFSGKGNHNLRLQIAQPIDGSITSSTQSAVAMMSGYIHFTSDRNRENLSYRIMNHSYSTDW